MRNAAQLFARLYAFDGGGLLEALSGVLTPEADQGIDARVEAAEGVPNCAPTALNSQLRWF